MGVALQFLAAPAPANRGRTGKPRHRRFLAACSVLMFALLAGAACDHSPTRPAEEPDLKPGKLIYQWCPIDQTDFWPYGKPAAPTVIVDALPSPVLESGPNAAPYYPLSAEQEARITAHGARILYRFNANMVRIEVPTDSLAAMVKAPPLVLDGVLSVPDTLHHDYVSELVFDHTVTSTDSLLVLRLGGWPKKREPDYPVLDAIIPDSIVPELRNHGLIHSLVDFTGCGAV